MSDSAEPPIHRRQRAGSIDAHMASIESAGAVERVLVRRDELRAMLAQSAPELPIRPGDIVRMVCEFGKATVRSVDAETVWVDWPWPRWLNPEDPRANLPRLPLNQDEARLWDPMKIRTQSPAPSAGDSVEVGIEPMDMYVMRAYSFLWKHRKYRGDPAAPGEPVSAISVLPIGPSKPDRHEVQGRLDPGEFATLLTAAPAD